MKIKFLVFAFLFSAFCCAQTINPRQIKVGTNGQCLVTVSGVTAWASCGAGTIGGTIAANQLAGGTGANTIGPIAGATFDSSGNITLGGWIATGGTKAYTTDSISDSFGSFALSNNTSGSANAAFGYVALGKNTTGGGNAAFGYHSLWENTVGASNTFFGVETGNNIVTGTNNTGIGFAAGPAGDYTNTIAIGYSAAPSASNQIVIGNSSNSGLVIFGCASGKTALNDGSGTCYTPQPASVASTPSHTAACTAGSMWFDSSYIYVCITSGTVERAALSTF